MEIYEYDVPYLSLREVAEELRDSDVITVGTKECIAECHILCLARLLIRIADVFGAPVRDYVFSIDQLRDMGIGGTAKFIAFGCTDYGEDVLYTFM